MANISIMGSESLAKRIKTRRKELGLTIEEAASRAGVGTKTWNRYEAGGAIRRDKCKGLCRALKWDSLSEDENKENIKTIDEYRKHEAWSAYLENEFGIRAALSFACGSDILLDHIRDDLQDLSSLPKGTHLGQLANSWIAMDLPPQFLMYYDYDFLYEMKCALEEKRLQAHAGVSLVAHSVLQELIIYLCNEEAKALIELDVEIEDLMEDDEYCSEDWPFDLFGDMDIVTCLYSNWFLQSDNIYHFSHWREEQFYN